MTRVPDDVLRWAEVDVHALRHNASVVRGFLTPSTALLAMVKAGGYGHGATLAARAALEGGATWLGVYTPDEAIALRRDGLDARMLVCGWTPHAACEELIRLDVDITVFDEHSINAVARAAQGACRRARIHLKIDSGLGRLGVRLDSLSAVAHAVERARPDVELAGIFTHYADAENDAEFTIAQHRRFVEAAAQLRSASPNVLLHTCGSAGMLRFPELHHDLVRAGIALYGYDPRGGQPRLDLRPAMSVFARIAQVKTVEQGESVGYGRTWRAPQRSRIATVAMGYGQGLSRALSNRGWMVVRGERVPIVGTVSMDQVTVDVSHVEGVTQGETAMLFGRQDGTQLGADEVADALSTISYEVLCAVASSVPRIAVGDATPGAARGG